MLNEGDFYFDVHIVLCMSQFQLLKNSSFGEWEIGRCGARPVGHLTVFFAHTAGHLTNIFKKVKCPGVCWGGPNFVGVPLGILGWCFAEYNNYNCQNIKQEPCLLVVLDNKCISVLPSVISSLQKKLQWKRRFLEF